MPSINELELNSGDCQHSHKTLLFNQVIDAQLKNTFQIYHQLKIFLKGTI